MSLLTVIGIGNRLRGDDAIGPLAIDALRALNRPELELIDAGSDALGVLEYFENKQRVLLIDACLMGRKPGTIIGFEPAEAQLILNQDPLSLHGLGLSEALEMARSLKLLPEELKIYGIEPDYMQFEEQLSPAMAEALESVVSKVQNELQKVEGLPQN